MQLIRQTIALLLWIVIYIPTTMFVTFVMFKVWFEQRQQERSETSAHRPQGA
jgi:hypothetical protein